MPFFSQTQWFNTPNLRPFRFSPAFPPLLCIEMFPHLFIMFLPGPPLMSRTVLVPTTHRLLRKQLENLLVSNAIRKSNVGNWNFWRVQMAKWESANCEEWETKVCWGAQWQVSNSQTTADETSRQHSASHATWYTLGPWDFETICLKHLGTNFAATCDHGQVKPNQL